MLDPERVQRLAEHMTRGRTGLMPFGPDGPVCIVNQSIYTVSWSASGKGAIGGTGSAAVTAIMDFDFVSTERRTGEVHAWVKVDLADPIDPLIQYAERLNMTSLRSKQAFAKQLAARSSLKMDWVRMIDQACQWVLSRHRAGEPAVILPDAPDPDEGQRSPLPPFLAADGPTIWFGDGGATKSMLALAASASLQTGLDVIPGFMPGRSLRVGYLDWEWSAHVHKERLRRLLPESRPEILYVPCRLSLREERDRLRHIIREHSLEFLVLDSVALAAGGEPESAEVAVGFFSSLRELAIPSLLIAHVTNAAARGHADRPFGSAFWHNSARSTWYIKRAEETSVAYVTVGMYHRKANDEARYGAIGLRWHFDEAQTWIERVTVADEPALESELPVGKRISLYLATGPRAIHEIAEETGIRVDTVSRTLRRGAGRYYVQFPGKGGAPATWALAQREGQS